MLNWLGLVLSPITEIGKQWLQNRAAIKDAEATLKVKIIESKAKLAESEQTHNNAKELKTLEVAAPWVRWVIVGHVLALFDVGIFYPERAEILYRNLESMPGWVVGLFVTVFGFYFAVDRISQGGADLISSWRGTKKITKEE